MILLSIHTSLGTTDLEQFRGLNGDKGRRCKGCTIGRKRNGYYLKILSHYSNRHIWKIIISFFSYSKIGIIHQTVTFTFSLNVSWTNAHIQICFIIFNGFIVQFNYHPCWWISRLFLLLGIMLNDSINQYLSEKAMAPHSSTLAWKIPWRESLVGCSLWGR